MTLPTRLSNTLTYLKLIFPSPIEIRAIAEKGSYHLVKTSVLTSWDEWEKVSPSVRAENKENNVFATLNALRPDYVSTKEANTKLRIAKSGGAVKDKDIESYRWLLVDCDPVRKCEDQKVSSSVEEKESAWKKLLQVRDFIGKKGLYPPVVCDSGNGFHLLYKISLPASRDSTNLLKSVLKSISERFSDGDVKIDKAVFNLSRVVKLYGTVARKGTQSPRTGRQHRVSGIIEFPEETLSKTNTKEMLEALADSIPAQEVRQEQRTVTNRQAEEAYQQGLEFVRNFCEEYSIAVREEYFEGEGTKFFFDNGCPFNPEHRNKDAYIEVFDGSEGASKAGKRIFKCSHDSCAGHTWTEFIRLYDKSYRTKAEQDREVAESLKANFGSEIPNPERLDEFESLPEAIKSVSSPLSKNFKEFRDSFKDVKGSKHPYLIVEQKGKRFVPAIRTSDIARYIVKKENMIITKSFSLSAPVVHRYINGAYVQCPKDALKGVIRNYIPVKMFSVNYLNEIYAFLTSETSYVPESSMNKDIHLVNFRNGMLDIRDMTLKPHDPSYLSTVQIPFDYIEGKMEDGKGVHPSNKGVFDGFLRDLSDNDEEIAKFDRQYMGAVMSNIPGHNFKKALFLVGVGNTGKSKVFGLLGKLLTSENTMSIDLSSLEERFGTSAIYGKRLSGCSDASFMSVKELKVFKQVTGGDTIFAERKGQDGFSFVYKGFLLFASNSYPKFGGDKGEWVYDRVIIQRCDNAIPEEKQDAEILDKMYAEKEYIAWRCLYEVSNLIKRKNTSFDIPSRMGSWKNKYRVENSSSLDFINECCTVSESDSPNPIRKKLLYSYYVDWCKANGERQDRRRDFNQQAFSMKPVAAVEKRHNDGIYFSNITLNETAKSDYGMISSPQ